MIQSFEREINVMKSDAQICRVLILMVISCPPEVSSRLGWAWRKVVLNGPGRRR